MPAFKRQHYVPRCHLKPFSVGEDGAAINIFNIPGGRAVPNASVKGQCARNYFYGDDLELEQALKVYEDEYSRIVRLLQSDPGTLTDDDLDQLRGFAFLQYQRTLMATQRMRKMNEGAHYAIYEGRPVTPPDLDISDRAMMLQSMLMYVKLRDAVCDLKICIIKNQTSKNFVTSDDPAIVTSKFYIQRLGTNNFGIGSSGVLLCLPLTPRFLLMCYDGDVYSLPEKRGCFVLITNPVDADALNQLQFIKAADNIYFSSWEERDQIAHDFSQVRERRRKVWCEFSYFVPDGFTGGRERFRKATDEERRSTNHTLLSVANFHPEPTTWLSKLKYRDPVRTFYNGSAAGHVRKATWQNRFHRPDM